MKLKKLMAAVLSFSLVCGAVPFNNAFINDSAVYAAEEYTVGTYGVLTYKNYGEYIEVTDCDESATEVEIPSEIDGVPVTSIGDDAFNGCISLTSITIPDSVTSIGDYAFFDCSSLTSITIPDSVTSIGDYVFFGCSSLTSITIPDGVTSIGECAFCKCENLTSISIPESVVDFGKSVFESTPWFKNKRNENPMVIINDILINGMNCTGDIIIPEGVTKIASSAFCEGALGGYVGISPPPSAAITSVCLPKTLKTIDFMAFTRCENLKEVVILGKIEYVESTAFFDCTKLESMVILNEDCDLDFLDSDFNGFSDLTVYGIENSNVQKTVEEQIASRAENNRIQTFYFSPISKVYGDINTDGVIDSSDASSVLAEYALLSTGSEKSFSQVQIIAADVNNDGAVDSSDASSILAYYAFVSTGGEGTLAEFLSK